MRLAVLTNPESWYYRDLLRAAGDRHQLTAVSFVELASSINRFAGEVYSSAEHQLDKFDGLLVRSMPPGSLEQVVFRMDVLGRLADGGTPIVNPPRSLEIAVDKFLALARLRSCGLPVPETTVCQTVETALEAYDALGRDTVIKPLFGSEGRGIMRVSDPELALRVCKTLAQLNAVIYLQRYIPDACDVRLMVLDGQVYAMRRNNSNDWRSNVSRGATTQPYPVTDDMRELAFRAVDAVGAQVAGVDVLIDQAGDPHVIEVNAVPGWRALARTLGIDIADRLLGYLDQICH